jgi:hypothetical protein
MVGILAAMTVIVGGACSGLPDDRPPVSPPAAKRAVETALALNLYESGPPDSPQLANVLATYASAADRRSVLVLVFDSPTATRQVVGSSTPPQPRRFAVVAEANVVVIIQPARLPEKAAVIEALRRARR